MSRSSRQTAPPAERWVAHRVAHAVGDLDRTAAFHRDLLGLAPRGGFTDHDGYSGVLLTVPGGGELELTTGPVPPRPAGDDDLLVLYVATREEARRRAAELESAGVPAVAAANAYWDRWGRTFLDPDGRRVVIAAVDDVAGTAADVRVERHTGAREELRPLFELAEDSPVELDSYLHAGRVLVAVTGGQVAGHLQLLEPDPGGWSEVKNMAVQPALQGRGVGRRLVEAAADLVAAEGGTGLLVATAAADVGNLRFYQRQGFRLRAVERDAFSPATGYPPGRRIDGIPLRDRVWLDLLLERPGPAPSARA